MGSFEGYCVSCDKTAYIRACNCCVQCGISYCTDCNDTYPINNNLCEDCIVYDSDSETEFEVKIMENRERSKELNKLYEENERDNEELSLASDPDESLYGSIYSYSSSSSSGSSISDDSSYEVEEESYMVII